MPKEVRPNTDRRHALVDIVLTVVYCLVSFLPVNFNSYDASNYFFLLFLWPATNNLLFSIAYLFNGDLGLCMLGKSSKTGKLSPISTFFFFPSLLSMYLFWRVKHCILGEPICEMVHDGIWVGRYPIDIDVNDERFQNLPLTHVVDLTAEFPSKDSFHGKLKYLNAPSLDCLLAHEKDLVKCLDIVCKAHMNSSTNTCTYVHCANGHGRSGLFAGMMLVVLKQCVNLDESKIYMRRKRKCINWQKHQQIVAENALKMYYQEIEEEEKLVEMVDLQEREDLL
jgi:protein-tyrosine phosphatase